ncbi:MAG TPA: PQQ-dependent sugar dehydrogenase [Nitrososphaeraceae archaeon]|nr:PQQ-dependent sugar dehydrogenase [Nitrososphaeraceae archaeon]
MYASTDSEDEDEDENGPMIVEDPDLKVELVFDGLEDPTNMAFLGKDDILVLEQEKGTVQRIVNGDMLEQPILDVDVANEVERGLLGIAVAKHPSTTYVFLYYTESSDGKDGSDECERRNLCEIGQPIGHRLYRYELDNKLINPELLLDIPPNPGADHVGGVIMVGPDNNIYLVTGDGNSCMKGCEDGIKDTVVYAQTANVKKGDPPQGRGGILRVTQDGQPVGKGILGDEHPLSLYYAYGIRNSFGMDFDPITGNLWDTENGPGYGDEINLVEPGFNSGWNKAQAMWPVTSYEQLDPTPKERGYFGEAEIISEDKISKNLVVFNGNGKYSNPELAWNFSQGVTAIKFFNSNTLGQAYENDIFVGDVKSGNLYHFDLNEDRTQLELKGPLSDKVVNSLEELDQTIFGKGFPTIVDIEVSPDGYLYILTYGGSIYRIVKD